MNLPCVLPPRLGSPHVRLPAQATTFLLLLISCLVVNPTTVRAQFILSPVDVSETGLGTFSQNFGALTNVINQSGIKVPFASGSTDFDTYFAPPNSNFSKNADRTKWQSLVSFALPFGGTLDFDLGDVYLVSKVAIWNISVKSLTVAVSSGPSGPWADPKEFSLSDQQSSSSLRATVLDLGTERSGRYVRLGIESEYPALPNVAYGYVTIGEVVMRATSPALPTVEALMASNGGITIKFTGILQFADDLKGAFHDVPGNPTSTYAITNGAQAKGVEFFRARK